MGIPDGAYTHGSGGSGPGTAALVLIGTALAVKAARQSCPRPPNCSTRSSS